MVNEAGEKKKYFQFLFPIFKFIRVVLKQFGLIPPKSNKVVRGCILTPHIKQGVRKLQSKKMIKLIRGKKSSEKKCSICSNTTVNVITFRLNTGIFLKIKPDDSDNTTFTLRFIYQINQLFYWIYLHRIAMKYGRLYYI